MKRLIIIAIIIILLIVPGWRELFIVTGLPFLFIYAIYCAIKGIMTHHAELKHKYRDDENRKI